MMFAMREYICPTALAMLVLPFSARAADQEAQTWISAGG
ncbi:MAG: DUF2490 domain-containing protein, partial [Sphingobium sp.]